MAERPHSACGEDEGRDARPDGLTRNETLVWDVLSASRDPCKAYEILDVLKANGVRAPMTVYRALDSLEEKGLIHKLEALNSFLICSHDGPHSVQAFLVCETCASATEIMLEDAIGNLNAALRRAAFAMNTARLEIRGHCQPCRDPERGPAHAA